MEEVHEVVEVVREVEHRGLRFYQGHQSAVKFAHPLQVAEQLHRLWVHLETKVRTDSQFKTTLASYCTQPSFFKCGHLYGAYVIEVKTALSEKLSIK